PPRSLDHLVSPARPAYATATNDCASESCSHSSPRVSSARTKCPARSSAALEHGGRLHHPLPAPQNAGCLELRIAGDLDGRSVASTCATSLCSNADRSSSGRPDKITDVPNSAAIKRPMRHNGSSRWQRGLMLGACFLALQVQVDVAEESGKQDHA